MVVAGAVVGGGGGRWGMGERLVCCVSCRRHSLVGLHKEKQQTGRTREAYITIKVKLPDRAVTTFWREV